VSKSQIAGHAARLFHNLPESVTSRPLALLTLLLVLLAGSWVRVDRLGAREFWTDELNHVFAARALNNGEGPLLPSGEAYPRGLVMTRMIAAMDGRTDDPERDARLPSALFGIVGLLLIAGLGWRLGGPWTAVWATALLAIYPEAIEQSQNARFYTYQMALGMLALGAGWFATRPPDPAQLGSARDLATRWGGVVVAALAFALGYQVQPTTLAVAAAFAVWCTALGISALVQRRAQGVKVSVPLQVGLAGAVLLLALLVSGRAGPMLEQWMSRASWRASWVTDSAQTKTYYFYLINSTLGWGMAFLPVAALVAFRRAPRLTLYLLTWFVVPLALHSLLLEWKGARYFLLPVPALLLLLGLGASELFGMLRAYTEETFAPALRGWARGAAAVAVMGAGGWAVITLPAFSELRARVGTKTPSLDWTLTGQILDSLAVADSLPIGSTDPLMSMYFWKRVDVGIQPPLMDYAVSASPSHPVPRYAPKLEGLPHDYYTGLPLILSPDSLRAAYGAHGGIILGVDPVYATFTHPELRIVLDQEGVDLCADRCGRLQLYLWRFPVDSGVQRGR
jgi:hypothetical protein